MKYIDEKEARIITIYDSFIVDEKEFVNWVINSLWSDCYMDSETKSLYYINNDWLCESYFDLFYKGYNILDWYNGSGYWENTDETYVNIEVV